MYSQIFLLHGEALALLKVSAYELSLQGSLQSVDNKWTPDNEC